MHGHLNVKYFIFLSVQVIFICVYITNYLHFFTMFLSFYHFKTLKTITLVKTNFKNSDKL